MDLDVRVLRTPHLVSLILLLQDIDSDKENEVPHVKETPVMNAFHKALLETKNDSFSAQRQHLVEKAISPRDHGLSPETSSKTSSKVAHETSSTPLVVEQILTDDEEVEENVVEKSVTPPRSRVLESRRQSESTQDLPRAGSSGSRHEPARPHGSTELSATTKEGSYKDGFEVSSAQLVNKASEDEWSVDERATKSSKGPKPYPQRKPPNIDMENIMDIEDITRTINFNAISTPGQSDNLASRPMAALEASKTVHSPHLSNSSTRECTAAPLPHNVVAASVDADDRSEERQVVKPHVTEFPTIGRPSPLRKSTRAGKDSLPATTHVPRTTKSAVTRSSWLVKAREAKAIEEAGKRQTILSTYLHHTAAGSKRKSGDMLDTERTGVLHNDMGPTQKLTKIAEASPITTKEQEREKEKQLFSRYRDDVVSIVDDEMRENADGSDGMINKLKKTVAGFSARAGRSMGKSLGGAAATALAEAVAAAEAKVAERNAAEGRPVPAPIVAPPREADDTTVATSASVPAFSNEGKEHHASGEKDRRLSVSDLVTKLDAKPTKVGRVFKPQVTATTSHKDTHGNTSTSTTPPNSPPKARAPVFTLPEKPKLPPVKTYFAHPITQVSARIEPHPSGPSRDLQTFHSQSTLYPTQPTFSDAIFDHEMPAWVPSTQDTDLSDHGPVQSSARSGTQKDRGTSVDESWHLDENFGETWTPITAREVDMTWSTAPTRSTRSAGAETFEDTLLPPALKSHSEWPPDAGDPASEAMPSDNPPHSDTDELDDQDMDVDYEEGIASVRLVTPAPQSKNGHYSVRISHVASKQRNQLIIPNLQKWPASGQADKGTSSTTGGFFSSASKLVSSVLGGSKKGTEPVKSLQLAAVAAKKVRSLSYVLSVHKPTMPASSNR